MKRVCTFIFAVFALVYTLPAQDSRPVMAIPADQIGSKIKGNLTQGSLMTDLSWAWQSNNACFVQTQQKKFTGHHVLYSFDVPPASEFEIIVTPVNPTHNLSLYAYMVNEITPNNIVPNLRSCIRCEADFKWDYKKKGMTQDHSRIVKDILATDRPFKAIIGVVGAEGLSAADYNLVIKKK